VRVLFVDDHEDTRALVSRMLSDSGAQVTVAESALQALAAIQNQIPDVVLSDLSMAGDDGCELLHKVRSMDGATTKTIPAVALTALVSEDQRQRAMNAGFQEFVGKPFDRAKLISILASISRKQ
jgi:CheY-like chemotaxis protein